MRRYLACISLMLVMCSACTEEMDSADSRAQVLYQQDSLVTVTSVYATLDDGKTAWNFDPASFQRVSPDTNIYAAPEVRTEAGGSLGMTFELVDGGGTPFSDGSMTAVLSPNWRWSFEIVHGDSIIACIDCLTTRRYDINAPGHDGEFIHVLLRGRGP